jgi:hypothetical protein
MIATLRRIQQVMRLSLEKKKKGFVKRKTASRKHILGWCLGDFTTSTGARRNVFSAALQPDRENENAS